MFFKACVRQESLIGFTVLRLGGLFSFILLIFFSLSLLVEHRVILQMKNYPLAFLLKTSISEGFTSSCLIRQLIYCMSHRHLLGPFPHSHHQLLWGQQTEPTLPRNHRLENRGQNRSSKGRRLQSICLWMTPLG